MVHFVPPSPAHTDTLAPGWQRTVVRLVLLLIFAGLLNSVLLHLA